MGAEEHLARLVSGAGLPPTRAVVRHPLQAPHVNELRHSTPADGVTVVRRSATSHALLTEGESEPVTRPLSADPPSTEFVGAVPVDNERLRDVLAGLVEPATSVPMGGYVTVDERWQSPYGVATHRYLIAPATPLDSRLMPNRTFLRPGEPLTVPLADGTMADRDVSVDSRSHLFAAERRADCTDLGLLDQR
ncbi:hypothetical protein [Micromonospora okii]|uniref:hypothetical protein n=1 Tax=Micromonospora okii TaxID=1182970 RepID=UPI001E353EEB|nr:hypothetical protein [Micromonospora okii]